LAVNFDFKETYDINDLLNIMAILRGKNGCDWDREQDHHSIRNNFIEEVYEAVEAIDSEDTGHLKEELGDVLMQVVFHARMEQEAGSFDFSEVCDGVCKKLIVRHPHVFGDVTVKNSDDVLRNWDNIKKHERSDKTAADSLTAVSKALPALIRAAKVQKRARDAGFDYTEFGQAYGDLLSEVREVNSAVDSGIRADIEEEIGDLLFAAVNVARLTKTDPEEALYRATEKFIDRFSAVEELAMREGITISQCDSDTLELFWKEAKNKKINGGNQT